MYLSELAHYYYVFHTVGNNDRKMFVLGRILNTKMFLQSTVFNFSVSVLFLRVRVRVNGNEVTRFNFFDICTLRASRINSF